MLGREPLCQATAGTVGKGAPSRWGAERRLAPQLTPSATGYLWLCGIRYLAQLGSRSPTREVQSLHGENQAPEFPLPGSDLADLPAGASLPSALCIPPRNEGAWHRAEPHPAGPQVSC